MREPHRASPTKGKTWLQAMSCHDRLLFRGDSACILSPCVAHAEWYLKVQFSRSLSRSMHTVREVACYRPVNLISAATGERVTQPCKKSCLVRIGSSAFSFCVHLLPPNGRELSASEQVIILRHGSLFARQMSPAEHVRESGFGNDVVRGRCRRAAGDGSS